jgi:hypothetical protein
MEVKEGGLLTGSGKAFLGLKKRQRVTKILPHIPSALLSPVCPPLCPLPTILEGDKTSTKWTYNWKVLVMLHVLNKITGFCFLTCPVTAMQSCGTALPSPICAFPP